MYTFVKIKDYPDWFLLMDSPLSIEDMSKFNARMMQFVLHNYINAPHNHGSGSVAYVAKNPLNYNAVLCKYGCTMLIREIGSYMNNADNLQITETFISKYLSWPTDTASNVVICENDLSAEPWWLEMLTARFSTESIATLNCFSRRTLEDLKTHLEFPKFITFTTTFTTTTWFENLINTIKDMTGKVLIVHWKGDDQVWIQINLEFMNEINTFLENGNTIEIFQTKLTIK